MTARELHQYLRSNCPWVDPERTVDTFKAGHPETEVRGIAVSWMSRSATLEAAWEHGYNVFITHEPTYWDHTERPVGGTADDRAAKEAWLAEREMVVIRCHDMLDQMPGFGIQDAWARQLGWEGQPFEQLDPFRRLYTLSPTPLRQLCQRVARSCAAFGQNWVEFLGEPARTVSRVGIGTGAIVGPLEALAAYRDRGADAVLLTELNRWRELSWAEDVGLAVVLVDHCVSECAGMKALAVHLGDRYPMLPVGYLPAECPTRLVTI